MEQTKYTNEEILKVVNTLVGNINPQGESTRDRYALHNLKILCDVVYDLIYQISDMHNRNKDSYEASRKRASEYADNFLQERLGIKNEDI